MVLSDALRQREPAAYVRGHDSWTLDAPPRRRFDAIARALDDERPRFFLWAPVSLGLGIGVYFALRHEPTFAAAWAIVAIAVTLKLVTPKGTLMSAIFSALCLAAFGFALAKSRVDRVEAPVLDRPIANSEVTGTVRHVEARLPKGHRVTLDVHSISNLQADRLPERVRIRLMSNAPGLKPGTRLKIKARLTPPSPPALPGGFDYGRSAWFERLGAVGYTFAKPEILGHDPPANFSAEAVAWVDRLRTAIGDRVRAVLPGEAGAIATALMTGERGGISEETSEAFKNSGLFHILSISGLHMVVMAGAVFYVVRLLLALHPRLALVLPIKKIAAVAGMAAALFYLAISGGAFATVRAALMILVMFIAVLVDRPALALRNVALSALIILALYPESLLDAGFQMSFAAVTGLIAAYEELRRRRGRREPMHALVNVAMFFGGIIATTLIAGAAVAPFAAYHFHQSQQYAVLANLIAIPICNLVVMPAALLALVLMPFGLEAVALWPLGQGIAAMTWCAEYVGNLPGAVGHVAQMPIAAFLLFVIGGLWLMLWQSPMRRLGLAAIAAGVALAPSLVRPDILIGNNGDLVAIRGADGLLSSLSARHSAFELERWLRADGDGRDPKAAQKGDGFSCDGSGCVTRVKGLRLAVPRHASALVDDCASADVLVLATPRPKACAGAGRVIDLFDMWREGTYAIYVTPARAINASAPEGGGRLTESGERARPNVRIETVAESRGARPWSMPTPPRQPSRGSARHQ